MKAAPGRFVLSFDTELLWGTVDLFGPSRFGAQCETERAVVIDRLLELLARFDVPATWFMVGHLLLESCDSKHPEIVRPRHSWVTGDWFDHDPGGNEATAPLFFGRSLVERIRACPTVQEIGCHSFSHVIFGDSGCSHEAADSDLAAAARAAESLGIRFRSFAFPRNSVGHLELLARHGFTCYRGPEPRWYSRWPTWIRRGAHFWDVLTAWTPPTVLPVRVQAGLINLPGSMIYLPMHGIRRHIPVSLRVERARKGLERAAATGRIFHLWTHPTNLVDGMEAMFAGLAEILAQARRLRDDGRLSFATVGDAADAIDGGRAHGR